jgi:hypothetical protein
MNRTVEVVFLGDDMRGHLIYGTCVTAISRTIAALLPLQPSRHVNKTTLTRCLTPTGSKKRDEAGRVWVRGIGLRSWPTPVYESMKDLRTLHHQHGVHSVSMRTAMQSQETAVCALLQAQFSRKRRRCHVA